MKEEMAEDVSLILFLIPILVNGLYGLVLWLARGFSVADVFLSVTRDPWVFLIGVVSICLSVLIDWRYSSSEDRTITIRRNAHRIQLLAYFCFASAFLIVWGATGFVHLDAAGGLFFTGKYALIFPALLMVMSVLFTSSGKSLLGDTDSVMSIVSILLLLASPFVLYLLWRIGIVWYLVLGFPLLLIIISLSLMLTLGKKLWLKL
jgi:hypothetical protein